MDTNILSALWSGEPGASDLAQALSKAKEDGALMISGVVYAELLAYPKATEEFVRGFTARTGITVQLRLEDDAWIEAGRRFAKSVDRRRQTKSQGPKRLLADFLIGAHALFQADRLMTLDAGRYERDFPDLLLYPLTS